MCQAKVVLEVPTGTAELLCNVLGVDPELRPDKCSRSMCVQGQTLVVEWKAESDKMLRTAVLSFLDTLKYAIDCTIQAVEMM
jgi:tRNA threonylcarbamoyladenosine modification (KEOPS) complex  Pcc1 subunit